MAETANFKLCVRTNERCASVLHLDFALGSFVHSVVCSI